MLREILRHIGNLGLHKGIGVPVQDIRDPGHVDPVLENIPHVFTLVHVVSDMKDDIEEIILDLSSNLFLVTSFLEYLMELLNSLESRVTT